MTSDRADEEQAKRYEAAMAFADAHDNLPDGAFWALAEEQGLYPEDFDEPYDMEYEES